METPQRESTIDLDGCEVLLEEEKLLVKPVMLVRQSGYDTKATE